MTKVSKHGRKRILERTGIKRNKERERLFKNALRNGKSKEEIEEEGIRKYVERVERRGRVRVKVYEGYVFLYSKNKKNKKMITMYKIPVDKGKE